MKTKTLIAAAIAALAVAAGQVYADALEKSRSATDEQRQEQSRDRSQKASATVDQAPLLRQGLAAILPWDPVYEFQAMRSGWSVEDKVRDRLNGDIGSYYRNRIAELQAAGTPEAAWAAQRLAACEDVLCVAAFARREVHGLVLQQAGKPALPGFAETPVQGWRRIISNHWPAWQAALVRHARTANRVEDALGQSLPTTPMPLAARRMQLVEAFYALPDDLFADPPVSYNYRMQQGQGGTGIAFELLADGRIYRGDENGMHILGQSGPIYGAGHANNVKYSYAIESSGNERESTSHADSRSTTGRDTHVLTAPGVVKPGKAKKMF